MSTYENRFEWHKKLNETVTSTLEKIYPRDWKDEDHLTRSLLSALREAHASVTIKKDKITGSNTKCKWDIYKNTKEQGLEPKYGDIGVLVQLHFEPSKVLEGVAFLEAKRIYPNADESKSTYEALDFAQLSRYCENSIYHRTVLYDCIKDNNGKFANALTLPSQHLLTINKKTRELHPYCELFSYCLTNRYFQGYELDYNKDRIDAVKGFLNSNGGVDFLIVAQVTLQPNLELNPDPVAINKDIYKRLISSRPAPDPGTPMP